MKMKVRSFFCVCFWLRCADRNLGDSSKSLPILKGFFRYPQLRIAPFQAPASWKKKNMCFFVSATCSSKQFAKASNVGNHVLDSSLWNQKSTNRNSKSAVAQLSTSISKKVWGTISYQPSQKKTRKATQLPWSDLKLHVTSRRLYFKTPLCLTPRRQQAIPRRFCFVCR